MLELSKMQGLAGGSRAPLGLLLVCLSLPGLFARSIGAPEEKISPHSEKPSFTNIFKLGTAGVGQPQPKPDPANNELPRALPRLPESPPDGVLPEESSEEPSQPFFWEGSPMESWLYEDPQPGMEAADEDHFEQVLPEAVPYLPYLSRGSPRPVASSASEDSDPEDLEPDSSPLRTEAEAFAQHPFWFFIHRLLPGFPWGILNPSVPWGGGGAGTGWGRRPMPYPSGIWGSNGQLSGTNLVGNGRYPVGSWGGNSRYPVGSWGGNAWNPAGSWGGNGWNQLPPGVRPPRPNRLPPGVQPPRPNRLPPGVRPPRPNRLPPGVRPPRPNRLPPGVRPPRPNRLPLGVRPPRPNRLPPGVRPPGSSGNIPNLSFQ